MISSDNGLLSVQHLAIIWGHASVLLIWPLRINFSEIQIKIKQFSIKKWVPKSRPQNDSQSGGCPKIFYILTITSLQKLSSYIDVNSIIFLSARGLAENSCKDPYNGWYKSIHNYTFTQHEAALSLLFKRWKLYVCQYTSTTFVGAGGETATTQNCVSFMIY